MLSIKIWYKKKIQEKLKTEVPCYWQKKYLRNEISTEFIFIWEANTSAFYQRPFHFNNYSVLTDVKLKMAVKRRRITYIWDPYYVIT